MQLTSEYIASLRKKVHQERERKQSLRKEYIDAFLDHHIPDLEQIGQMLVDAIEENPDGPYYTLHILTIGIQALRDLEMTRREAIEYMETSYAERFQPWFKENTPTASLGFRVIAKKYIEVCLMFTLDE